MKKLTIIVILVILGAGTLNAQDPGRPVGGPATSKETKWTGEQRTEFITSCIDAAVKGGIGLDSSKYYCYCMLEKVEDKFPNPDDAVNIDLEDPEWVANVNACLGGNWAKIYRDEFLSNCVKSATPNMGETKANRYCECMLFKIERLYPNANDALQVKDKLDTPEWKKKIASCMF